MAGRHLPHALARKQLGKRDKAVGLGALFADADDGAGIDAVRAVLDEDVRDRDAIRLHLVLAELCAGEIDQAERLRIVGIEIPVNV